MHLYEYINNFVSVNEDKTMLAPDSSFTGELCVHQRIIPSGCCGLHWWMSFLGSMTSLHDMMYQGRLHLLSIQCGLNSVWTSTFNWFFQHLNTTCSRCFQLGLGNSYGHSNDTRSMASWHKKTFTSIALRWYALNTWKNLSRSLIIVVTDNTTLVAYIEKRERAKSSFLLSNMFICLGRLDQMPDESLPHPRKLNILEDRLSSPSVCTSLDNIGVGHILSGLVHHMPSASFQCMFSSACFPVPHPQTVQLNTSTVWMNPSDYSKPGLTSFLAAYTPFTFSLGSYHPQRSSASVARSCFSSTIKTADGTDSLSGIKDKEWRWDL